MDRRSGIYDKFIVERRNGTSAPGKKHDGCSYFVLDATHDPYSRAALLAYADSCDEQFPFLAIDLRRLAKNVPWGGPTDD
jgi:hypothetical protein